MENVIILNGWTKGDISNIPEFLPDNPANWMGWTKKALERLGHKAVCPYLKDGYKQEYEDWKKELEKLKIDENTTLVGWSAGGAFWVRWLGETKRNVKKLILVAPAKLYDQQPTPFHDQQGETNWDRFMHFTIDESIKDRVKKIIIFISNEGDCGIKSAQLYKKELQAKLIQIPNQGHFTNVARQSPEFPELLKEILE